MKIIFLKLTLSQLHLQRGIKGIFDTDTDEVYWKKNIKVNTANSEVNVNTKIDTTVNKPSVIGKAELDLASNKFKWQCINS